jgi:hypothetical protein
MMISVFPTPQQDQPASAPDETNETTPALRPWITPRLQLLNGNGTAGGFLIEGYESGNYRPAPLS